MNQKKYELCSYLVSGWRNSNKAIFLGQNQSLICMIKNPVDYVLDGLVFLNRKKVKSILPDTTPLLKKVFEFKVKGLLGESRFSRTDFEDFQSLFTYLKENTVFCELALTKESVMYIGKTINVSEDSVDIDFYTTDFNLLDHAFVKFDDIKSVTIFSDYSETFSHVITSLVV